MMTLAWSKTFERLAATSSKSSSSSSACPLCSLTTSYSMLLYIRFRSVGLSV